MPLFIATNLIALIIQTVAPASHVRLPHLSEVQAVVMSVFER
jgi:hypothetical protein